ncbi:MAG: hypothetical protein KA885_08515 [Spirochaetes bacterium]|nr:hypothetical protein [Spirochaetota bacterium]
MINLKYLFQKSAVFLFLFVSLIGCNNSVENDDALKDEGTFDALNNTNCFEVVKGETTYKRWLSDYDSFEYDYEGSMMTAINLRELINEEVTANPENFRYKIYGIDNYTFGDYASWTNIQNAVVGIGTRRVVFNPNQSLDHSYNIKWAYRIVLSPAAN